MAQLGDCCPKLCLFTITVKMEESLDEPGYFLILLTIAAAALTGHR
jgi:hypothetical protein